MRKNEAKKSMLAALQNEIAELRKSIDVLSLSDRLSQLATRVAALEAKQEKSKS